jgi:cupin 2 domain-containing protein
MQTPDHRGLVMESITEDVMPEPSGNLFERLPSALAAEQITTLVEAGSVRIERIVSHGHASPDGFWYDQDQREWVMVVQGAARLRFENESLELKPGDFVDIPAHRKHRVDWTTPAEPTVWLAVYFEKSEAT